MTAKQNSPKSGGGTESNHNAGVALPGTRAAKDLTIGVIIQVDSLEGDQVVRKVKRIRKGLDAGLLHVTLVARDGDRERIALAPEEHVTFVGTAPEGQSGKAKGKAQAKGRSEPETVLAPTPQAAQTPAPSMEPRTAKSRDLPKAQGENTMTCLDAAAKLLSETGQPMTCQQLIAAIASKGYWTSPAGRTPASTLYAAIVREMRTKKDRARFRKTAPGRFGLA